VQEAKYRHFLWVGVLLLIVLGLAAGACKDTEPSSVDGRGEPAGPGPVPADFAVVLGQGGGFTGHWEGYTIQRDGTVLAWGGAKAGDNPEPVGTLEPGQVEALWTRVQEAGFFSEDQDERGNMTATLRITAGGEENSAYWIPSIEGIEPVTTAVEKLYVYCREMARSVVAN
jgi:hypothetical protein